jgi:hypothetical protein
LTKADWCSICKANGARATEVLTKGVTQGSYELVVVDITSDETAVKGQKIVAEKGLTEAAAGNAPGSVVFVDPKTRKRLAEVTVAHQNEEFAAITALAQKRLAAR